MVGVSSLRTREMQRVNGFEAALFQHQRALVDAISKGDVPRRQPQTFLDPFLPQWERIPTVLKSRIGERIKFASPDSTRDNTRLNDNVSSQRRGCRWSSNGR